MTNRLSPTNKTFTFSGIVTTFHLCEFDYDLDFLPVGAPIILSSDLAKNHDELKYARYDH